MANSFWFFKLAAAGYGLKCTLEAFDRIRKRVKETGRDLKVEADSPVYYTMNRSKPFREDIWKPAIHKSRSGIF